MNRFLSYGRQFIDDDDIKAVTDVLKGDFLTQGPKIKKFEDALCAYTGAKFCVVVSNGTAALHLAVAALEIQGDVEGITTPNTFAASANCLLYNGIKPVFADIENKTYNIDPAEIKKKINSKTRLIIPVHFAGQACAMNHIKTMAKEHKLYIVEDAAHAIGSRYEDGSMVGNCRHSDSTVFSFHPVKTMTTGEGGAITTNREDLYKKLLLLRTHGITKEPEYLADSPGPWYYEMRELGYNYRLTDMQAALGISQLNKLDGFIARRKEIVERYNKGLQGLDWLTLPYERIKGSSAFHLYVVLIDYKAIKKSRAEVMEILRSNNIGTQVHYIPVYRQPYYRLRFGDQENSFINTELYYKNTLSIPLFPGMLNDEVNHVINVIKSII